MHHHILDFFSTLLEKEFLATIEKLRRYTANLAFINPVKSTAIAGKSILTKESFTWFVRGNIELEKPEDILKNIIDKRVLEEPKSTPTLINHVVRPDIKAYGTYFYPSIWIGEIPKRSFREKAKQQFFLTDLEQIKMEYRGHRIIMNQNGLLAIVNENKAEVLNMLNEIMSIALISGLPCYAIREPEVCDITIDSQIFKIKGMTVSLVSDRTRQSNPLFDTPLSVPHSLTYVLSEKEIEDIVHGAERIIKDHMIKKSFLFLLESYTHLQASEYSQCFIMGWTIIESYIASLWDKFLKKKSVNNKRQKKLQSLNWTTDNILETLNLVGEIDIQDYSKIMNLKTKRNKIIHSGETATKEAAEECFNVALMIAKTSVQSSSKLKLVHPQEKWHIFN